MPVDLSPSRQPVPSVVAASGPDAVLARLRRRLAAAKSGRALRSPAAFGLMAITLAACGSGSGDGPSDREADNLVRLERDPESGLYSLHSRLAEITLAGAAGTALEAVLRIGGDDGEAETLAVLLQAEGDGTLTMDFADAKDTVVIEAGSLIRGFDRLDIVGGTVDLTAVALPESLTVISVNSGIVLTAEQFLALDRVESSGDGEITIRVGSAAEAEAVAAAAERLVGLGSIRLVADDDVPSSPEIAEAIAQAQEVLESFETVTLNLAEALALDVLPANYILDDAVIALAPVTVAEALETLERAAEIVAGALNSAQFEGGVEIAISDSADAILAALAQGLPETILEVSATSGTIDLATLGDLEAAGVEVTAGVTVVYGMDEILAGGFPLHSSYAINPDVSVEAGPFDVVTALDVHAELASLVAGAANAADLTTSDLLSWSVEDDAAAILAVAEAPAIRDADMLSVTDATLSLADFDALTALGAGFAEGMAVIYTAAEALEAAPAPVSPYLIDADAGPAVAGTVAAQAAVGAWTALDALVAVAANAADITTSDLLSWSVEDDAAAILAVAEAPAIRDADMLSVTDATLSLADFEALTALGAGFAEGMAVIYTAAEALAAAPAPVSPYLIDADAGPAVAGTVAAQAAVGAWTALDALVAGAANAADLTTSDLLSWSVEDDAAAILAVAEAPAIRDADMLSVTDATLSLADFEALTALGAGFADGMAVIYTAAEALAAAPGPVSPYLIDAAAPPVDAGEVSLETGASALSRMAGLAEAAGNAADLDPSALLSWSIADTAAGLLGASEEPVLQGADSLRATDDAVLDAATLSLLKDLPGFDLQGSLFRIEDSADALFDGDRLSDPAGITAASGVTVTDAITLVQGRALLAANPSVEFSLVDAFDALVSAAAAGDPVLTAASDYALSDPAGPLGNIDTAAQAVLRGATNGDDYSFGIRLTTGPDSLTGEPGDTVFEVVSRRWWKFEGGVISG